MQSSSSSFSGRRRRLLRPWALAVSLVLSVALSQPVSAQKTYALGIAGGVALPAGRFGDAMSSGYNGTAVLAVGSPDLPIGIRFDGMYNHFSRKDAASQPAVAPSARIVSGVVNLIYTFPGTVAKAYVVAGAGYYNTKTQITGAKADNNIGFNGGVGATFGFGPVATFIETRYHSISRSAAKGGVIQFIPVTLGVLF
jgi:hypothetical protein